VYNKAQRLMFDQSSPNGILLFREASKILVAYGSRILQQPFRTDVYKVSRVPGPMGASDPLECCNPVRSWRLICCRGMQSVRRGTRASLSA
jgi:hypothetical protein